MKRKSYPHRRVARILNIVALACLLGSASFAANPVPTVTGPTRPQAVAPGRGDFTLTVYGANFVAGAVVNWNGSPRSTSFVSARELTAKIIASDVAKPTAGYITVTNPPPGGRSFEFELRHCGSAYSDKNRGSRRTELLSAGG